MKRSSGRIRLGVIMLFILGLLSPVAGTSAGAQIFTCEDLTAVQAQALLDADPDLADDLDADGDGIACNETGSTRDSKSKADVNPYVADVQSELDDLGASFDRFLEIDGELDSSTATDAEKRELVAEGNDIAADWVAYPDVAADLGPAPAELQDLEDGYLDLADMVGETGNLWEEYWALPSGDPDEADALTAFNDAFFAAQDGIDTVQDLVDEADGTSTPATKETADKPAANDDEAYLAAIQDEIDTIDDESSELTELIALVLSGDATNADGDRFAEIMVNWSTYPDDVADLVAPRGLEDIEDTHLELADTMAETSLLWDKYLGKRAGSSAAKRAFDVLADSVESVQDQAADVQDLLDEAVGGNADPTKDPTDKATGDLDAYLTDVSTQADDWNKSVDRFIELFSGDKLTDAAFAELADILNSWVSAPSVAADMIVPKGGEDVQDAFEDYADTLAELGLKFNAWANTEVGTSKNAEAFETFVNTMTQSKTDYDTLQDEIAVVS